ncbi:HNH endonuclease family protein [Streptomyces sp. NBC_01565]|uniref:HNH endonuclease family protein n=1 Tax=Streptomyces sp. NBC_01565 TaxID=2975881 RepID=UPI002254589D|nr:HNH endonuclease family protein [Streptomyces sp. NBC_01565]MCX4546691.1 HNH endonuclease family protein [Streptomyces sp. NBC_01565]
MIKNLLQRGLPALALACLPVLSSVPAAHADARPAAVAAVPGAPGVRAPLPLFEAVDMIPVAAEHREGYKRDLYKHWNKGQVAADGCDTRKEVILAEAVVAPQVAAGCKLTGGSWRSAYDDMVVTDAARLDVDHFVPLAEVFDSERTPWSAARREAYANDQNSPDTLIAVSAASNRSKADKDPAEWLPSDGSYHCTYAATWVGTKLRWDLAADEAERQALLGIAEDCPATTVVYEPAP